ncbi:MAG: 2-oxoacid:ferredoxin oxidoreductase subunit alpha [Sulfolobales archaeon]|nr:2-oxoacid:acceptor oxidoreductase subunit alpha [Sulfolobales archaeon]MDW8083132.1 2-oxoacid:ferredoxin oxidoreductase subunit alpha [Sulfolobales archaeon]
MGFSELSIILGGPQGSGLETSMLALSRALAYRGYGILADREYYSNIVGRHSYIHMSVSSKRIPRSLTYPVKLLISMDAETVFTHFRDVEDGGILVYDKDTRIKKIAEIPSMEDSLKSRLIRDLKTLGIGEDLESITEMLRSRGIVTIGTSFQVILKDLMKIYGIDPRSLSRYVSGIVTSSASLLLGLDREALRYGFESVFSGRPKLVEQNMFIADVVWRELRSYEGLLKLEDSEIDFDELLVATGNDVVAIAKIVSGLRYQSYYPITPAADESFFLEKYEVSELDGSVIGPVVVVQTEDEIAAINSAIGAALAGARSATATSGPGFDLMVEGLSWAGMNEVPVVITYYQRGGPSTGLPTRGSQSDLLSSVFAAHGEFAKVVISSGDHLDAFYDTILAFNIAEKYQLPVIHLLDKFLANSTSTIPLPDLDNVKIERGLKPVPPGEYKRFNLETLVSPRAPLGTPGIIMWYTGDEHDEHGHISEDPDSRVRMYSKRIEKLKLVDEEIPGDLKLRVHGDGGGDFCLIGWGSVKGAALDALGEIVRRSNLRGVYIDVKMLWPFPRRELAEVIRRSGFEKIIAVEHSYGVNIADLAAMAAGIRIGKRIAKFTGRPITLGELTQALEKVLTSDIEYVVISYGE